MEEKTIVTWGAGCIGRGFVADLFGPAGYQPIFIDCDHALVANLKKAGEYTICMLQGPDIREKHHISGYRALTTAEDNAIAQATTNADLLAAAVFPEDYAAVAQQMAQALGHRRAARPDDLINVILFTNQVHAGPTFWKLLVTAIPEEARAWAEAHVGIVESLVIRMVTKPPEEELAQDPLVLWTNGYAGLPLHRPSFKGELPDVAGVRWVENIRAEEQRKLYAYNTYHASLSYFGALHGCKTLMDCINDHSVHTAATNALLEASRALQAEWDFTTEDMAEWVGGIQTQTWNLALRDTVARCGRDPRRKVRRTDRLVGPLLLARKHGFGTQHLTRAVAAAFLYNNSDDPSAQAMQQQIASEGLREAVQQLCSLNDDETDIVDAVVKAVHRLEREAEGFARAKQAGRLGFEYERTYRGCGQCALAAILDSIDGIDKDVADAAFAAATGFAGGLSLMGDGICGALAGATMAIGLLYPRRREHFDGDRENKYRTYELTQQLRERFIETYGSITCHDIHTAIMGRPFDLRDPADREVFEAAGAHEDKCTEVVARAVEWTMEIVNNAQLEDEGA